jgi:DNA-directed RNA polymerase subunit RPC12/RpoP
MNDGRPGARIVEWDLSPVILPTFASGIMTTEYKCPKCGEDEPLVEKELMQGGVNCICSCGTKFHVCAF